MIERRSSTSPREGTHIEAATEIGKWAEWVEQSRLLYGQWMNDVKRSGFLKSPTATAVATGPRGVKHVCEELELDRLGDGDMIVEVGSGPGPIVQGVLRQVRAEIIYVAIELNPSFATHLQKTVHDSRLQVVNESAANLSEIAHRYGNKADRVISSMPFSTDQRLTQSILEQIKAILSNDGSFVLANFTLESIMRVINFFGRKNCRTGWAMNIPPLLTVHAKKPKENGRY